MSRRSPVYPDCYGHLYSEVSEQCNCCLLRDSCSAVIPSIHVPKGDAPADIPKDKKALVIAVAHKYGIPTKYFSKKDGKWYDVEGNEADFLNLDFLLTTKDALLRLLQG